MSAPRSNPIWFDVFAGVLLGTAAGDALGLPAENLSPDRIRKWWKGQWKMRFLPGRGMISDDTEHTLLVAQALISSPDSVTFQQTLAWKLRWWFAGLPGGAGLATARACLRLWIGFPANRSAVRSAGSGPAMRSAIIGAFFADDPQRRREFVLVSSRLTHKGWQAETAALAVAEAATLAVAANGVPDAASMAATLMELSDEREWRERISLMESGLRRGDSVSEFAGALGLEKGVSGYSLHVVPVALFAWLRHSGDFRAALASTLDCGGDTDTVGAILGALCGASHGADGIPAEWVENIFEWPRSVRFMRAVARAMSDQKASGNPGREVRYFWPGIVPRNIFFLCVVLLHGFRRLLPPY
ncbi:MAG TPA: ADP-ribosylglycohydrolase family protein [Verrucomicrobiae bacterium]|nr:ADP-ribosylglycohydrolase family protein [Verrucomicrobiae bacterium]